MTTATPTQRISDLESAAFRTDRGLGQLAEQTALIRGAVNELAVELREQRHDLTEVSARVEQIQQVQQAMAQTQQGMVQVQQDHSAMLRDILAALGATPRPNATSGE